jgi:hypothetical protein
MCKKLVCRKSAQHVCRTCWVNIPSFACVLNGFEVCFSFFMVLYKIPNKDPLQMAPLKKSWFSKNLKQGSLKCTIKKYPLKRLRNPKHGFKNSPVSTNSQTWVKSGDGPTQMGPVWDFVKVFAPGLWLW